MKLKPLLLCTLLALVPTAGFCGETLEDATSAIIGRDYTRAAGIYSSLAKNGNAEAEYQLGVLYKIGRGVEKNYEQAFLFFLKAAELGNKKAQYALGEMYEFGSGTAQSDEKAVLWYARSSEQGYEQAAVKLQDYKNKKSKSSVDSTQDFVEAGGRHDIEALNKSLANGENINKRDELGNTALQEAIRSQDTRITAFLLDSGADPNITNLYGESPLMHAVKVKDITLVRMLLTHGADAKLRDKSNRTAFNLAQATGQENIALLLTGSPGGAEQETARRPENIQAIIVKKQQESIQIDAQWPPLIMAAWRGRLDIIRSLVSGGADVNAFAGDGYNALGRAVLRGDPEIVDFLLAHGAKPEMFRNEEMSPLFLAAQSGQNDILKKILSKYALTDQSRRIFMKALDKSIETGHGDCTLTLINSGLSLRLVDKGGLTDFLLSASRSGAVELAGLALQKGAGINAADSSGTTALMMAAGAGHTKLVDFLLEKNADKNLQDAKGQTALLYAIRAKQPDTAKQLILNGADVSLYDDGGNTALILASGTGLAELIEPLTARGADTNLLNKEGESALVQAIRSKQTAVIPQLLDHGANPYSPLKSIENIDPAIKVLLKKRWTAAGWLKEIFSFNETRPTDVK